MSSDTSIKISVIIATYNGEKFIKSQLESILKQTITPDEVLIFDDNSGDSTSQIISEFISSNSLTNWKLKINRTNLGYENNFYSLLNDAKGDYIFLCDQDDIWKNDKLERILQLFHEKKDALLICSDNDFVNVFDSKKKNKEIKLMKFDNSIEKIGFQKQRFHLGRPGCDMAVSKKFFNFIKDYWIDKWAQDEFLWKFAYLNNGIYLYHFCGITRRIHENNTAKNEGKKKYRNKRGRCNQLKNDILSLKQLLLFLKQNENMYKKTEFNYLTSLVTKHIKVKEKRLQFIQEKNPLFILYLLFHLKYYPRKKGIFVDILVTYGWMK